MAFYTTNSRRGPLTGGGLHLLCHCAKFVQKLSTFVKKLVIELVVIYFFDRVFRIFDILVDKCLLIPRNIVRRLLLVQLRIEVSWLMADDF